MPDGDVMIIVWCDIGTLWQAPGEQSCYIACLQSNYLMINIRELFENFWFVFTYYSFLVNTVRKLLKIKVKN